jgi:AraC-like DNA-binding protein
VAIAGDLVMLPRGVGHILSDGSDAAPANASDLMEEQFTTERLGLRHGGSGEQTRLLAGAFQFVSTAVPWVTSALPGVIHIQKSGGQTGSWLEGLAHFMMVEDQTVQPGSSVMISRLIDVLVIRVIRTWVQTRNPGDMGWMGALSDPRISRALKAIHEEPFRRWSVAELASAVGMSRSAFGERFSLLVKEAPLSYQNRWRLTLAHGLLRQANSRVSDVARQVGYDSESAFSRAFKAQFGIPGRCQIGRFRLMTWAVESLEVSRQMSALDRPSETSIVRLGGGTCRLKPTIVGLSVAASADRAM